MIELDGILCNFSRLPSNGIATGKIGLAYFLFLYKDGQLRSCVPKSDYHFIQGKFTVQLLCIMHGKEEGDLIGTFHGSTLTVKRHLDNFFLQNHMKTI